MKPDSSLLSQLILDCCCCVVLFVCLLSSVSVLRLAAVSCFLLVFVGASIVAIVPSIVPSSSSLSCRASRPRQLSTSERTERALFFIPAATCTGCSSSPGKRWRQQQIKMRTAHTERSRVSDRQQRTGTQQATRIRHWTGRTTRGFVRPGTVSELGSEEILASSKVRNIAALYQPPVVIVAK